VANDRAPVAESAGIGRPSNITDECNLLYVAITRAKKRLQMSPTLLSILQRAGHDFCQLVSTKQLQKEGATFVCDVTKTPFEATNAVTLYRPNITLV
jgi:ATP-dependent exoDNAse (exonuclease V) beta subunit